MDAQDNLKIIHTVDGTSLQNRYGKSVIQSHDIGLISLPTGESLSEWAVYANTGYIPGRTFC